MLKDRISKRVKQSFYSFGQNIGLKAIAFTASITIWVWVQTQQVTEENFRSQIEFLLPQNLALVNKPTSILNVTLEGPTGRMRLIDEAPLHTKLDLRRQSNIGTIATEINFADIVNVPEGFKIVRISPPSIDLEFDELMARSMKISPNLIGTPKKGWFLKESRVSPERVDLKGARSIIGNMASVKTTGISLNNLSKTIKIEDVQLNMEHPSMEQTSPKPITIFLEFQLSRMEKKFSEVKIRTSEDWLAAPPVIPIVVEGLSLDIENTKQKQLLLKVQLPNDTQKEEFVFDAQKLDPKVFTLFHKDTPLNVNLSTTVEKLRFYKEEQ